MLFHSREFLLFFLPLAYLGWLVLILCRRQRSALAWLTLASLVFYAWWNPPYLAPFGVSVLGNFLVGLAVDPASGRPQRTRFALLTCGVAGNLALLGYFKYANFLVDSLNGALRLGWHLEKIILPLAISFYTFQQIAYLVDSHRGKSQGHSFLEYVFFISFFPQLIAGPIVHHSELLPQTRQSPPRPALPGLLVTGGSMFLLGLCKKMVLADPCGELAAPLFSGAAQGAHFSTATAWLGVLAYAFQIYFDFSGYSDMCVGLARMFGIRLPENFRAPYRAATIIEFWRRWHITLSRFLRDYLYIPLGGNRRGPWTRYRNLFLTMLIGGIWHGAGWNFAVWGGLHGLYLTISHLWLARRRPRPNRPAALRPLVHALGWMLTMLAVVLAWPYFRADSLPAANALVGQMVGISAQGAELTRPAGAFWASGLAGPWIGLLALICLLAPTMQSYFRSVAPVLETPVYPARWWTWRPGLLHGVLLGLALVLVLRRYFALAPTEFLYFNF